MHSKLVILIFVIVVIFLAVLDIYYHGHFSDRLYRDWTEEVLEDTRYNLGDEKPIKVAVDDRWIVLEGTVETPEERDRVADLVVRSVKGLRGLTNNLVVEKSECDSNVLEGLKNMVATMREGAQISYLISDPCFVTLTGWVPEKKMKEDIGGVVGKIPGVTGVDNQIEIGLPKKKVEDTIIEILKVQNIYFDYDKWTIRPESMSSLEKIAQVLMEHPEVTVRIEGHTDNIGSDVYNQGLSEKRAEAVRQALIERGVPASRLTAIGFGKARPVAPNTSPEGRAENRRIEFKVQQPDD